MTYLCWSALYEGASDEAYFDILIPRLMSDLILARGIRNSTVPERPAAKIKRGSIEVVTAQVCEAQGSFHIIFIHADTGGRNLEIDLDRRATAYCRSFYETCTFPRNRCIAISPRHEMEAWVLADSDAVLGALGYRGRAAQLGIPNSARAAERLVDPKATLAEAVAIARGTRRSANTKQILPAIAQRQDLMHLRHMESFQTFEECLVNALHDLGAID